MFPAGRYLFEIIDKNTRFLCWMGMFYRICSIRVLCFGNCLQVLLLELSYNNVKEGYKTYQAPNLFVTAFQRHANLLYTPKLVTLTPLITWLFYVLALICHSWVWKTSSNTYKLHCQNHLEFLLLMISTFLSILAFLFRQLLILSITARFYQWDTWVLHSQTCL